VTTLMDGAGFEFIVVEYAVNGASDDKVARFAGDHDAPELDGMDVEYVDGGDVDAVARAIANQWTPSHPAATVWRVKVHTSDGRRATAWDPESVIRRALAALPAREETVAKLGLLTTKLHWILQPYMRLLGDVGPEYRALVYGAEVFFAAVNAFGTVGTDVYGHNLDAMGSSARRAADVADEARMADRRPR
jgi:hypothetical protein